MFSSNASVPDKMNVLLVQWLFLLFLTLCLLNLRMVGKNFSGNLTSSVAEIEILLPKDL